MLWDGSNLLPTSPYFFLSHCHFHQQLSHKSKHFGVYSRFFKLFFLQQGARTPFMKENLHTPSFIFHHYSVRRRRFHSKFAMAVRKGWETQPDSPARKGPAFSPPHRSAQHTHHVASCHLCLLQHIRSHCNQVLCVLHPAPGLLCQVLCLLHRVLDVPQPAELTCQSAVDVSETIHETLIYIWKTKYKRREAKLIKAGRKVGAAAYHCRQRIGRLILHWNGT